ncbi:NADH-quinone oxidoreductase subunit C [Bacillus sp. CGMCC 1.16607]|uniref:NADH-quinone oxidoreductase subunit C n=1 Tax=Bacillus sp. CGMCC 1.16607 TaxID=3351842 RepID=UPI00362808A7
MSEKDLDQLKKEAAAKAKAAALAKLQAKQQGQVATDTPNTPVETPETEVSTTEAASAPTAATADEKAKAAAAAKAKAAAAAKAKAAALAKQQAGEASDSVNENVPSEAAPSTSEPAGADEKAKAAAAAKAKAAAAAKAKAAALAKQQASEASDSADVQASEPAGADEKAKAIAAAKAKAAAAAKAKLAAQQGGDTASAGDDEKAKAIAAAKAKAAAAAAAKAKTAGSEAPVASETPAAPSPNQPYLDKYVKVIEEHLGTDVLEDSYINKLSKDVPTLVVKSDTYFKVAEFLKYNEQLGFDYVSEIHGSDFETHMEVYVHLFSYKNRQSVALKVKIDRDQPVIQSLVPLWVGVDWPECEAYDLLGIKFEGHPNLNRIMLGEDWIGHPLRKDYEPYDVEV